ncbi:MAG: DUF975 family protein [Spirochaetaceae bacterium]|jgi:uncharacterized membrane protein|nr:DUF975 family protein [Spirochaetaceae bacterium]
MDIQNAQIRPVISQGMQKYGWHMLAALLIYSSVAGGIVLPLGLVFGGLAYLFSSLSTVYTILIIVIGCVLFCMLVYVLAYGLYIFPLMLLRGGTPDYGKLFIGFANFKQVTCMTLWLSLWELIWMIPLCAPWIITLVIAEMGSTEQDILFLASAISYIFMLVGICILSLRYAQAYYILYDNPQMPVRQALRRSIEMMQGNKKQFFFLIVSALWWRVLVIIGIFCTFMFAIYAESIGLSIILGIAYVVVIFWISLYSSFISPAFYQALITKVKPPEEEVQPSQIEQDPLIQETNSEERES